MKEYIIPFADDADIEKLEQIHGTNGELIHCRDCKHRTHNGTCIKVMKRKPDDGFCDEGERNEW